MGMIVLDSREYSSTFSKLYEEYMKESHSYYCNDFKRWLEQTVTSDKCEVMVSYRGGYVYTMAFDSEEDKALFLLEWG